MVMGEVLTQPQRMRRATVMDPGIALINDLTSLATRLAQDAEQSAQLAQVARSALEDAVRTLVQQRLGALKSVLPKLADWLLRVLRATTGIGPELIPTSSPAGVLSLISQLIDTMAQAAQNGNAARIQPYVAELLGIVQHDLGLSLPALETAFWGVIDSIIARLEALPLEADRRERENRLDTIRALRRMRRLVRGRFPLPALDADRIADALAATLRTIDAAALGRAAQCVAQAIEKVADAGQAIEQLVPLGALTGFRSLGAAAAVASGETYCWYASWLYEEDVIINAAGTEIRRGDTVIASGTGLTFASIPDFTTATPHYTFNCVSLATMETLTNVVFVLADAIIVVCHLVSIETGDVASNALNVGAFGFLGVMGKLVGRSPLASSGVEDWVYPLAASFAGSFQGIHTKASGGNIFLMWVTLFLPDFIEAVIYKQVSLIARDLVLSLLTLINYDGPLESSGSPDTRPLNRIHIDGVAWVGEWLGSLVFMTFYPREEYAQPFASGGHAAKFFLFWDLFLNNLFYVLGRLVGCILGMSVAQVFDFDTWVKPMPLKLLLLNPLMFIVSLYMDKEGDTKDGHYNPTGAEYAGYPDKASSPYQLPFPKDNTYYLVQGNQGFFSHHHLNFDQQYSYDFSMDQDDPILASRPGTVVDYFDWIKDNTNPDTTDMTAATTEATASGFLVPGQTTSDSWNFIAIRHDVDDAGAALPPDNTHDKAAGGSVVTTYAIYGHGRKGSVRDAFQARGVAANAIIGTKVKQGQRIMRSGDTGVSFNNHLHIMVQEGPASTTAPPVSRGALSQPTLPFVFKDAGVPKHLDWYESSVTEVV